MLTNRDAFPLQFEKDIDKHIKEGYALYSGEWDKIAKKMDAPAGKEHTVAQYTGLGAVKEIGEGTGVEFDVPAEGHKHSIGYTSYGLGFQITQEMVEDTLNKEMVNKLSKSLGEQSRLRQDQDFFKMLALGDGTTYRAAWDQKALFANNHVTLKSGDTINNLGASSLTETSLEAAFQYFYQGLVSEEGIPLNVNPDLLIIPIGGHFTAYQLMNQTRGVTDVTNTSENTNDNKMNPSNGYVSPYRLFGSKVLQQLMSAAGIDGWFLADSKALALHFLWKRKFKTESGDDFNTGNALFKGTMRYGVGISDYKGIYGSFT